MKKRTTQSLAVMCAMALSGAAWAQSNTDLPALPQDMSGEAPMPAVELPAPALAPAEPMPEPALPPAAELPSTSPAPAEMGVPILPATAAATEMPPATDVGTDTAPAIPEKTDFQPSYGAFENSLMYSDQDVDRMKKVLYGYERLERQTGEAPVKDEFNDLLKPVVTIQEPASYPSYYLSSIVYRSPNDWLVWINGKKYSPKKQPADIHIVSVNERRAAMVWKPEYYSAVKQRVENTLLDESLPVHFRSASAEVRPNDKDKGVFFTLAPNQTFVAAALAVFEGKYGMRAPPKMDHEVQFNDSALPEGATGAPVAPVRDADEQLRATTQELQGFNKNLVRLTPKNRVAGSSSPTITPVIPSTATPNMQPPIPAPPANTTN